MHIIGMINNLCHMIDMYRGVATLNKLINIDGDVEEVCNFAHIETIYIRLHGEKKLNSEYLSTLPSHHPKKANYNI